MTENQDVKPPDKCDCDHYKAIHDLKNYFMSTINELTKSVNSMHQELVNMKANPTVNPQPQSVAQVAPLVPQPMHQVNHHPVTPQIVNQVPPQPPQGPPTFANLVARPAPMAQQTVHTVQGAQGEWLTQKPRRLRRKKAPE